MILVTGGAGFVGANLLRELSEPVRVLDDMSTGSPDHLQGLKHVETWHGSVTDLDTVREAVKDCRAIVHLAARPGVRNNTTPEAFTVNVDGTYNVARAARDTGARLVFASSMAAADPTTSYGMAKAVGELMVEQVGGVSLRFANLYGPWSAHKTSVVPTFCRRVLAGLPPEVHGSGEQARDFVDVRVAVAAILDMLHSNAVGVIPVATGTLTTINDLARMVTALAVGKAPESTLERGIKRLLDWYRKP